MLTLTPGALIAIDVLLLYTILGPLVLSGIYVFFDYLAAGSGKASPGKQNMIKQKDPALWTSEEIELYMDQI